MAKKAKNQKKSGAPTTRSVIENLSLVGVRLVDLTAKLEIKDGKLPDRPKIESSVTIGTTAEDGKTILVDGILKVEAHPSDAAESGSILLLVVHFQTIYKIEVEGPDFQAHADIIVRSAMLTMWPHFREVIQSTTSRMGIAPIVLPMFMGSRTAPKENKGDFAILGKGQRKPAKK